MVRIATDKYIKFYTFLYNNNNNNNNNNIK